MTNKVTPIDEVRVYNINPDGSREYLPKKDPHCRAKSLIKMIIQSIDCKLTACDRYGDKYKTAREELKAEKRILELFAKYYDTGKEWYVNVPYIIELADEYLNNRQK